METETAERTAVLTSAPFKLYFKEVHDMLLHQNFAFVRLMLVKDDAFLALLNITVKDVAFHRTQHHESHHLYADREVKVFTDYLVGKFQSIRISDPEDTCDTMKLVFNDLPKLFGAGLRLASTESTELRRNLKQHEFHHGPSALLSIEDNELELLMLLFPGELQVLRKISWKEARTHLLCSCMTAAASQQPYANSQQVTAAIATVQRQQVTSVVVTDGVERDAEKAFGALAVPFRRYFEDLHNKLLGPENANVRSLLLSSENFIELFTRTVHTLESLSRSRRHDLVDGVVKVFLQYAETRQQAIRFTMNGENASGKFLLGNVMAPRMRVVSVKTVQFVEEFQAREYHSLHRSVLFIVTESELELLMMLYPDQLNVLPIMPRPVEIATNVPESVEPGGTEIDLAMGVLSTPFKLHFRMLYDLWLLPHNAVVLGNLLDDAEFMSLLLETVNHVVFYRTQNKESQRRFAAREVDSFIKYANKRFEVVQLQIEHQEAKLAVRTSVGPLNFMLADLPRQAGTGVRLALAHASELVLKFALIKFHKGYYY